MTTVFEVHHDGTNLIDRVVELLDADSIARKVEYPIDRATEEFQVIMDDGNDITPEIFNRNISSFVRQLYERALRFPRKISDREAFAEAIHFFNQLLGIDGPDRYGAILTTVIAGGREELERVLLQLSEIIKETERRKYRRWVVVHHIHTLEWRRRCNIATLYKESMSQSLPVEWQELEPEQLAEYLEDVIAIEIQCRNIFKKRDYGKGRGHV